MRCREAIWSGSVVVMEVVRELLVVDMLVLRVFWVWWGLIWGEVVLVVVCEVREVYKWDVVSEWPMKTY